MLFGERLKSERTRKGLSQKDLAKKIGITERTIQNYESGNRTPYRLDVVRRIAEVLQVTSEYLLGEDGMLVVDAAERGGSKAKRDMEELVSELTGMFAGGKLSEQDRDAAMRAVSDAYWQGKEINKKYTRKDYRK